MWVLVLIYTVLQGGQGVAATSVQIEFSTKQQCEAAKLRFDNRKDFQAVCLYTGE